MVITLEKIFKDVVSEFPVALDPLDYTTVVRQINHGYIEVRDEFIKARQAEEFANSQTLTSFSPSGDIPYLQTATLTDQVLGAFPLNRVVFNCFGRNVTELTSQIASFSKGDKVWKAEDRYRAVSAISALNTFALTFTPDKIRPYFKGNGLKYAAGDVVFEGGEAFEAINDITVTSTDPLSSQSSAWKQVYWVREGIGYVNPEIIDFERVDRKKTILDIGGELVSVVKDTLYTSTAINKLYIEYIPEHTDKEAFADTFQLPDQAFLILKKRVAEQLLSIFGQQPVAQEEEDGP